MEKVVAEYASKLLSDDPCTLSTAYADLKKAQTAKPPWSTSFPRLVQELAIYQQGSIIRKLLKQVIDQSSPSRFVEGANGGSFIMGGLEESVAQNSLVLLGLLAASQTVALFSLRDEGVAEKLLRRLMWNLPRQDSSPRTVADQNPPPLCILRSLEGIVSYARASERFRQVMRDEEGLLPAVQSLFEDENIKHICENVNVYAAVRHGVIDLILSLTLAKDSQEWMIDKGFLTLLASICATDRYDMEEIPATMSCATVLWRLCDSPTLSRKIKEAGELSSILEPYSRLLNSKLRGVWDVFQETMRRRSGKASKVKAASVREIWKYNASKFIGIAAVCSWEGCSEGLDLSLAAFGLDLEGLKKIKKLSRCGRCGMAYYCSKDHQKLHWVTHKKDCFDATAN